MKMNDYPLLKFGRPAGHTVNSYINFSAVCQTLRLRKASKHKGHQYE